MYPPLTFRQCILALSPQCGAVWSHNVAGSSLGQPRSPEVAGQAEAAGPGRQALRKAALKVVGGLVVLCGTAQQPRCPLAAQAATGLVPVGAWWQQ